MKTKFIYFLFAAFICQLSMAQTPSSGPPNYVGAGLDVYAYPGETVRLYGRGGISYLWQPSTGLSNDTVAEPFATLTTTTTYTLTYIAPDGFSHRSQVTVHIITSGAGNASCTNWIDNGDFNLPPNCIEGANVPAPGWQNAIVNTSIDCFNTCMQFMGGGGTQAPINWWGNIAPYTGSGYGGLANEYANNYYEYYQQELTCPLVPGQLYNVSFVSALASSSAYICGDIGAYLSAGQPVANASHQLIGVPQLGGAVLSNTWVPFSAVITGNNQNYITIGSFNNLAPCVNSNPTNWQYNYIDDVIITPATPTLSTSLGTQTICIGSSPTTFNLTETGSPGGNCVWTGPSGFTATGSAVTVTVPSTPGTYTYTCTINLGCSFCNAITNTIVITVLATNPLVVTTSPNPLCTNTSEIVNLHVTGAPSGTYYSWSPAITPTNAYSSSGQVTEPPGVYTYSVSAPNCYNGTTTFTVSPFPSFTVSPQHTIICIGQTTTTFTASNPTLSYSWTPSAGLSSTTGSVVTANPTIGTAYAVTGINPSTGCSFVEHVTVQPYLPLTVSATSATICPGEIATITVNSNDAVNYMVSSSTNTFTYTIPSPVYNPNTFTISPSTTTVYTITGSNPTYPCPGYVTFTVTVKPLPIITATATPSVICVGQTTTLTASGGVTYTWSPSGSHSNPLYSSPAVTTTYSVHGTGTNGCANTGTVVVDVNPLPTVTHTGTLCAGQNDIITITNATTTNTYSWTAPTGESVSCLSYSVPCAEVEMNPANGTYTLITTNTVTGCHSSTTFSTSPLPVITAPSATICVGHTASIPISSGGTVTHYTVTAPAQSFTTATGSITYTTSPTVTTTYTVTGENASGCYSTKTFTVFVNPLPTINVAATTTLICGPSHGVVLTASGSALSYTWSSGGFFGSPTATVTPANNTSTTYTVDAIGIGGCLNTATITIYDYSNPPVPSLTGPLCTNQNNIIAVTNTVSSSTYSWTAPSGGTFSCVPTPTPACSQIDINNPTGVYTVTVTDNHGCHSQNTITTHSTPTVSIAPPYTSYCINAAHSVTLTASGGYSYTWSPGVTSPTNYFNVIPPLTSTHEYTVTGYSVYGCKSTATATINVITTLPTITVNSPTICAHTSATLTASGANTYTWSPANITGNPYVTGIYPGVIGTYQNITVTGTAANGCTGSTTVFVTVAASPTITVTPPTATICAGSTTTLTSHGASSYTWTPASSLSTPTGSVVIADPTTTTIYTVTGGTGCTAKATETVTVKPAPTLTVTNASICLGSTTTLSATGATTYTWSANAGGVHTNTVSVSPIITTDYTVTGTSLGCSSIETVTVTVTPIPTVTVNSPTICIGATATLTAHGATTYSWTPPTGLSATTGSVVTANPTITTSYTITGTLGSCHSTTTATVTVAPPITLTVNSPTICAGSTASLTANGATTYTWSANAGGVHTNTVSVTPSTTTDYTITGTSGGCSSSKTATVTVNSTPTVTVNSPTICIGGTATLTASGATTYSWIPAIGLSGTTGTSVTANPSTTTSYTVIGVLGSCSSSAVSVVTVNPATNISVNSATICAGATAVLTASGATTYSWTPATGLSATIGNIVNASPFSTTIYTVTGATGSCILIPATSTVTVIPFPTVSVNSETICPGSTATLTASGATTYSWTPATGLSSTTGNTVDASPSSTIVYSVTGTSATCSLSSVAVATVTVISPSLTITPSANPVCIGSSVSLTASGASTYTWSGLGITGLQTATVTTPNLNSNTDYTVSGTVGSCTASTVITVSVAPGTVTISYSITSNCSGSSATSNTICSGQQITLIANSSTANTYTWSPGGLNTSSITVSPTVTTVYTVDASSSTCTSSNTFTVYVLSDCNIGGGSPLPMSGTVTGGLYYVNSSFTINTSLTINTSTVTFAPNVSITVASGASLVISNSHLYAATNTMWQGIIVPPGASIMVNQNTMIEDAVVAIDNGGSASNIYTNLSPSIIQVDGAIFNCNYTAISESFYQSSTPANYGLANFSISDAVFTCRCGIVQTQGTTPYLNTYTNSAGPANISNPTINDFYSVANYPSATLKAPFLGQPAFEGIHLEGNYTIAGLLSDRIYNINYTTPANIDIFDNLSYGINVINSTFSVTASAFQFGQQFFKVGASGGGYGINSSHNLAQITDGISVNNSQFIDLVRGINNLDYYQMDVENNTFFSTQVASPLTTTAAPSPAIGQYGMYVSPYYWNYATLSNNTLANLYVGIDFVISTSTVGGIVSGEDVALVSINTNTLVNEFPPTYPSTSYIGNGIIVDNTLPIFSAAPSGTIGSEIQIKNNVINNAYRGILARNQQYQLVRDENNTITMIPEPTASSTLITTQYGIEHNKVLFSNATSISGVMTSTVFPTIFHNSVTGFITPADYSNPTYFESKKGIWSNLTANTYVTCNSVTNAGRGIEFSGYNDFTTWRINDMTTCGEGFVLSANGGTGIIQQQGAAGDGSDNFWSGFSSNNPETYVDGGSTANSSVLYIQNTAGYIPLNNITGGTFPYINSMPGNSANIFNAGSGSTSYNCQTVIAGRTINSNQGTSNERVSNSHNNSSSTTYNPLSLMEKIVIDSLYYLGDSAQNSFINKNIVYRTIKQDTGLMTGSTILHNFYTASQTTCRQLFCVIEDSLYTGNYAYASTLVNSFTPSCTIEQNYKRFYQIFMDGMQNVATGADSTDLETLASSCPLLNGEVVYNARAFHNSWYKGFQHYEDNCPASLTGAGYRKANTTSLSAQPNQVAVLSVYPNPNNGKVYISGFDAKETTTSIEITDVTGKLIYKQQSNVGNGIVELNLQLISGVYFVHIINTQGATQIQKIVINN